MSKHKDHHDQHANKSADESNTNANSENLNPNIEGKSPSFNPGFSANTASQSATATIEKLQQQLEKAQAELVEANDKMLRSKAEAENTRRRAALDVENAHKYSIEKLAKELLNVVDSLERGLQMAEEPAKIQAEHLHEGMELTYKLLVDALDKFNIKVIDPIGQTFDPKQHEALTMQPSSDVEPNKVLTVVQKGFTLQDRILRPARVVVAKAQ